MRLNLPGSDQEISGGGVPGVNHSAPHGFWKVPPGLAVPILIGLGACRPEGDGLAHFTTPPPSTSSSTATGPTAPVSSTPSGSTKASTTSTVPSTTVPTLSVFPDLSDKNSLIVVVLDTTKVETVFGETGAPFDANTGMMPGLEALATKYALATADALTAGLWTGAALPPILTGTMPGSPMEDVNGDLHDYHWNYQIDSRGDLMPDLETLVNKFQEERPDTQTCYVTENPIPTLPGDKLLKGFTHIEEYSHGGIDTTTLYADCGINSTGPSIIFVQLMALHGPWGNIGEPVDGYMTSTGWQNCKGVEAPEGFDVKADLGPYNNGTDQLKYAVPKAFLTGDFTLGDPGVQQLDEALRCGLASDALWMQNHQLIPLLEAFNYGEGSTALVFLNDHGDQFPLDQGVTTGFVDHSQSIINSAETGGFFWLFAGKEHAGVFETPVSLASTLPTVLGAMGMDIPTWASAGTFEDQVPRVVMDCGEFLQVKLAVPDDRDLLLNPLQGLQWVDNDGNGTKEAGWRSYKHELGIFYSVEENHAEGAVYKMELANGSTAPVNLTTVEAHFEHNCYAQ